jgi:hypothetical protein
MILISPNPHKLQDACFPQLSLTSFLLDTSQALFSVGLSNDLKQVRDFMFYLLIIVIFYTAVKAP